MTAYGLDLNQERERKAKENANGTSAVLSNMAKESAENAIQTGDNAPDGMTAYRRNGKVYWRSKRTTETTEENGEEVQVGRPT